MCGCNGKYKYSSANDLKVASKNRGYEVTPDEVNDRQVSRVLNILKEHKSECEYSDTYVYLEIGKKCWAVYND